MKDYVKGIHLVSKITAESAVMAVSSIKNDKFRTFLSLLGVSIGIFSIVAVFCAVNALKANINEGLSSFGSDVVYIQDWPFSLEDGDTEFKWWEYRLRPPVNEKDYNFIRNNTTTAETVCYMASFYALAKCGGNSFSDGYVLASTSGFDLLCNISVEYGRYFSASEMKGGANVTVIGVKVAETLFGNGEAAIGKEIKIKGAAATVIGVMKKEGSSIVSLIQKDVAVIVPLPFGKALYDVGKSGTVIAAPKAGITTEDFQGEMRQLMRAQRRLKPSKKDNFAVNSMTFLIDSLSEITNVIEKVGWIIACFSLLIGGFGIANIMFVSVKERTVQIGIQKALGAPKYVILTQFLVEASVLALSGGLIGVSVVFLICTFVHPDEFVLLITVTDALKGLLISLVIGILSGIIPAWSAAKLNPVDSMNA